MGRTEAGLMLWPTVTAKPAGEVLLGAVVSSGVEPVRGDFETEGPWAGEVLMGAGTVAEMAREEDDEDTGGEPLATRKALN